jgi:hypothetical protein
MHNLDPRSYDAPRDDRRGSSPKALGWARGVALGRGGAYSDASRVPWLGTWSHADEGAGVRLESSISCICFPERLPA